MKKTIVFDFDNTLTDRDTLLKFFLFCSKKDSFFFIKVLIYMKFMILSYLRLLGNTSLKNLGIRLFLSRIPKEELERLGKVFSETIKLNKVYETEFVEKYNHCTKIIATASFSLYIKPLFPKDTLIIASEVGYSNNHPSNMEFNCYGEHKRRVLRAHGIERIDILYTDSKNDLPLAEMAKKIYLVKKGILIECKSLKDFLKKG